MSENRREGEFLTHTVVSALSEPMCVYVTCERWCVWKYVCRVDQTKDERGNVKSYAKKCAEALSCTSSGQMFCSPVVNNLQECTTCNKQADDCLCCTLATRWLYDTPPTTCFHVYSFRLIV